MNSSNVSCQPDEFFNKEIDELRNACRDKDSLILTLKEQCMRSGADFGLITYYEWLAIERQKDVLVLEETLREEKNLKAKIENEHQEAIL